MVGIKPTFGLVPRSPGFSPPSWASLAHTGPIARTVADAALLLEAVSTHDLRDAASLPVPARSFDATAAKLDGIRIGSSVDFGYAAVAPDIRKAFQSAVETLGSLDASIVPDCVQFEPDMLDRILKPIAYTEQAAAVSARGANALMASDSDYRDVVTKGASYSGIEYVEAGYRRNGLRTSFLEIFGKVDAIVTPTVAVTAFAAGALGVDGVDGIDGVPVDRHLGWSPFSWPINKSDRTAGCYDSLRFRRRRASDWASDHCAVARRGLDCAYRCRVRARAALEPVSSPHVLTRVRRCQRCTKAAPCPAGVCRRD
ncbi:Asp-tRNA(Asn)/Glu-tRNA(Gln) amidotransferase A subunit family amidase [Bradyrhizobium sp. AZCC 1610]